MDVSVGAIVIDCEDPARLAAFWRSVTSFETRWESPRWVALRDPAGKAPDLAFQKVPEKKAVKNRVHLDLDTADEERTARHIEAIGATRLRKSTNPDDVFIVLADPEGNEFCVVRSA